MMKTGQQHIGFDELLALHHGGLSLKVVNEYQQHLEECSACKDVFEGIQAFHITDSLTPQLTREQLEEDLFEITQQYIKSYPRHRYMKMVKCHFYKHKLKYSLLVAASFLLIIFMPQIVWKAKDNALTINEGQLNSWYSSPDSSIPTESDDSNKDKTITVNEYITDEVKDTRLTESNTGADKTEIESISLVNPDLKSIDSPVTQPLQTTEKQIRISIQSASLVADYDLKWMKSEAYQQVVSLTKININTILVNTKKQVNELVLTKEVAKMQKDPIVQFSTRDSLALIVLYYATNGSDWINTWDINQPVRTWEGVTLDVQGRVINIKLPNNQLVGFIPKEIGNLHALEYLVLSNNSLSGQIPSEIDELNDLRYSNFNGNKLTGVVLYQESMLLY